MAIDPQGVSREPQKRAPEPAAAAAGLGVSEEGLRALFGAMTDLIVVLDRQGRYLQIAPTHPRLGGPIEELKGKAVDQVFPPEQVAAILRYIGLALDTRETVKVEYRQRMGEQEAWFSATVSPLSHDKVLWVARDITERKRTEEALGRYTARLEVLTEIDHAILAARSTEQIGRVALARVRQLVPFERASIVLFDWQKGQAQFVVADMAGQLGPPAGTVVPLDNYPTREYLRRHTGVLYLQDVPGADAASLVPRHLLSQGIRSFIAVPLMVEGELIGELDLSSTVPAVFTEEHEDIAREVANQVAVTVQQTRLREQLKQYAEELERRVAERTAQLELSNKELEAFSYSVSHDLRAPLQSIELFSRLLDEDYHSILGEEGGNYLQNVRESTRWMDELIEALLALSRVTRAELKREKVDLSGLARLVLDELAQRQPERKAEFIVQEGVEAEGDPRLLRTVLENLLGNAWKYTSRRTLARIEFGLTRPPDGRAAYYVRDDGVGFDMKHADKLFGAFQRLHSVEEFPGIGIGLATVQRIIRRHGGRIWAEGQVDQGATFYFTLGEQGL